MAELSGYIAHCIQLTSEIEVLLELPGEPVELIEKKMQEREETIYNLKRTVDKVSKEKNQSAKVDLTELIKADKRMRTKLENRFNQTKEALRMLEHEEKAGRSYIGRLENSRFITGRLEG